MYSYKYKKIYIGIIKFTVLVWQEQLNNFYEEAFYINCNYELSPEPGFAVSNQKCYWSFLETVRKVYKIVKMKDFHYGDAIIYYKDAKKFETAIKNFHDFEKFIYDISTNISTQVEVLIKLIEHNGSEVRINAVEKPGEQHKDILLCCNSCGHKKICPNCNPNMTIVAKISHNSHTEIQLNGDNIPIMTEDDIKRLTLKFEETLRLRYSQLKPTTSDSQTSNIYNSMTVDNIKKENCIFEKRPTIASSGIRMVNHTLHQAKNEYEHSLTKYVIESAKNVDNIHTDKESKVNIIFNQEYIKNENQENYKPSLKLKIPLTTDEKMEKPIPNSAMIKMEKELKDLQTQNINAFDLIPIKQEVDNKNEPNTVVHMIKEENRNDCKEEKLTTEKIEKQDAAVLTHPALKTISIPRPLKHSSSLLTADIKNQKNTPMQTTSPPTKTIENSQSVRGEGLKSNWKQRNIAIRSLCKVPIRSNI